MRQVLIALGIGVAIIIVVLLIALRNEGRLKGVVTPAPKSEAPSAALPTPAPGPSSTPPAATKAVIEPTDGFVSRVTLKPFGIHVTPQNSPVSPERFSGYHTGADAEYGDLTADVPVKAVADSIVVLSRTVDGYGGVMIIKHQINSDDHLVLYGHIRPSSLPKVGQTVKQGDQIGLLGTAFSTETDGERRHLHLAFIKGSAVTIKGYVQTQAELSDWENPLDYLK